MNYNLISSTMKDKNRIIQYKLNSILDFSNNLSANEINQIHQYVEEHISEQLSHYKNIVVNNKIVGCLLVESKDDGVLLDEIYIDKEYRNKGIGTDIIINIIKHNPNMYLWVYKKNTNAIKLYKKLGFIVLEETATRYYMKYDK